VQGGKIFEIDIDGVETIAHANVESNHNGITSFTLAYERAKLKEEVVGKDTILQSKITQYQGCSGRTYVKINVVDLASQPLADEKVYLKEREGDKVFMAIADDQGVAEFLVPNVADY